MIESVEERHTILSRAARTEGNRGAGDAQREHVIIANPDQVLLVFAAAQPSPDLHMLDRFLVAAERAEVEDIVIVVNKVDLEDPSHIDSTFAPYLQMGYTVVRTSAYMGSGVDELRDLLTGKVSAFTGPSGVGKTSLLNQLQPDLGRSVKQVSKVTQEGVHTTRDSALIKLACGGYLADTPGMRYLNVWDIEPEELDAYFVDIAEYVSQCRFGNCSHTTEPGCAVKQAVKDGEISFTRYKSYRLLRHELDTQYAVY